MGIKEIQAAFKNVLYFAFLLLAFACISDSHKSGQNRVADCRNKHSSFEEQSKHHGRFLLSHAPRLHFSIKEQKGKNFYQDFILSTKTGSFFASFYTPASGYFQIIYLFFLKHQLLLYPFHSLW